MSYPYLARTTLKYKSPHATDLSFAKDETIRVTGPSPDDEDWLVGETLDGSKQGGFPKDFITPIDEEATSAPATESAAAAAVPPVPPAEPKDEPVPSAPAGASETAPTISAEEPSPSPVPTTVTPPTAPHLDPKSLPHSTATTPVVATPAPPSAEAEGEPPKQSMKDRLAFFAAAQNKAAPPPPVKPKPATGGLTWSQRQKLRQEQEAKEREAGGAVSEQPVAVPTAPAPSSEPTTTQTQAEPEERGGMSAADAQSSITKGGSLKERMAALQGAGAFGSPAAKPPPPPKPSGKVWTRPAAPPEPEPEDEPEETAGEAVKSSEGGAGGSAEAGETAEADEPTEEEQEKARRAAIAARMAKLGARGPMGMPPPKPARKPTREAATEPVTSPPVDVSAPTQPPPDIPESQNQPLAEAISPPPSVAMPAIPRRTAGPRRRGPATPAAGAAIPADREEPSEADNRLERVNDDGTISPPPQVMVADEEKPLPKTEEALRLEQAEEAAGRGPHGAEGAAAAGIAMTSEGQGDVDESDDVGVDVVHQPVVGALGTAGSDARGVGVVGEGEGEIFDEKEDEPEEIEEGLVEGGDEKDEIMQEAEEGYLAVDHGAPTMVPVHPPAEEEEEPEEEETAPPPPPRMRSVGDVAKDEVELKHEHDAQEEEDVAEEEAPPPPPRRISTDRPLGPRPLPTAPSKSPAKAANPLPPPPAGNSMVPPRDDEEDEREAEGLGDEDEEDEPAPPPPPRKPSMPAPLQIGVPTPAAPTSPVARSPTSPIAPRVTQSPPPVAAPAPADEPAQDDSEEASRRSGIAARMAKLGGIKFGMPPPGGKKPSASSADPMSPTQEAPTSPVVDAPKSPIGEREVVAEPVSEQAGIAPVDDGEETPEQEAARRRATLARLRAGGALGFGGMFGHGPTSAEPQDDERGIEQEEEAPPPIPAGRPTAVAPPVNQEDDAPPPPARPPVPGGRPMPPAPATEEDVAPPPPARQASISRPVPPPPADDDEEAPPPPARPRAPSQDVPPSPVRAGSVSRPPVPNTEKRRSLSAQMEVPAAPAPPRQVVEEPTTILEDEAADAPPPPPPNRPAPQIQTQLPQTPRRSMSSASRTSKLDSPVGFSPASRQASRQDTMPAPPAPPSPQPGPGFEPRQSFSQARPGFNELQAASRDAGVRLARAARGMFDQGKKAYYGDGSPAGFVLLAMENAQLPRPQQAWGLVVFEQEAASVLKRHDEPRPGDIAAFHDAKLKGKKGLQSYTQQVGSVEDPLVGVVIESEAKKHKLRVLQVERGVPEEVSYRCDDLKSGRVVVYRPGI